MADLKQIAVASAVAILFAVFVIVLIDAVYERPEYSDYCERFDTPVKIIQSEDVGCDYEYGEEYQQCERADGGTARFKYNESGCRVFDECDFCNKEYEEVRKVYTRNVFLIAGLIGVAAIFAGTLWKIEFLASGIMFGGIILLFYATVIHFSNADKILRVIIIFVELLLVLWIGYKKLYKAEKKRKK